jgi:hypothetical protein
MAQHTVTSQRHTLLLRNQQEITPQILQLVKKFYSVILWPVWELSDNTSQMEATVHH